MLSSEMEVGIRNLGREQKSVMLHASGFSKLLESLRTQHLAQSVRRIHGTIDDDVSDVYSLG